MGAGCFFKKYSFARRSMTSAYFLLFFFGGEEEEVFERTYATSTILIITKEKKTRSKTWFIKNLSLVWFIPFLAVMFQTTQPSREDLGANCCLFFAYLCWGDQFQESSEVWNKIYLMSFLALPCLSQKMCKSSNWISCRIALRIGIKICLKKHTLWNHPA